MRLFRWARVPMAVAVIALAYLAITPAGAATVTPTRILGSGSDTTYFMMLALDELYDGSPGCNIIAPSGTTQPLDGQCLADTPKVTVHSENYAHDQVTEAGPLGSSNGISQLCQQGLAGVMDISFARSSRAPRDTDCKGLRFVGYARDGLSWESFPGLAGSGAKGVKNLTQQQLKDIFLTCKITNWNQVGGGNAPIAIYTPQLGSGTRGTWDGFLGGASDTCIPTAQKDNHIIPENENEFVLKNKDAKNAIFPFSFGAYENRIVPNPDGSSLNSIDGTAPTTKTIANGSFAFGRFLFNVYCGAAQGSKCGTASPASSAVTDYVGPQGWICKSPKKHVQDPLTGANFGKEIQTTIKGQGFVPVPSGPIGGGVAGKSRCRLFTT